MAAAPEGSGPGGAKKPVDANPSSSSSGSNKELQKPTTAALEEDDEFEDFPIDDWPQEETEAPGEEGNTHLWEESWDDDDTSEDFSKQLRQELEKVRGNKQ